jgi:16S rRNA (guanine527-N7)-methyltransferase
MASREGKREMRSETGPFVTAGLEAFAKAATEMGVYGGPGITEMVEAWFRFYADWTGRRVVGFSSAEDIAVKLIADSFSIGKVLDGTGGDESPRAMDLGSGNGWPGLAVRALRPSSRLALLDSRLGACRFLNEFVRSAGFTGIDIVPERAEKAQKQADYIGKYDLVTTRAMARPGVSLELSVAFCRPQGRVALWLGPEHEDRVRKRTEIAELGIGLSDIHRYALSEGKGKRLLVVYRRLGDPLRGYPRSIPGMKARPLL